MKCSLFPFFLLAIRWGGGGDLGSGSGSKFNRAARVGSGRVGSGRVGSGQTISGTGRVRASVLSPCRPLAQRSWVQFPVNTYTDNKCIAWMHCKSLWIKASAKCINVNVYCVFAFLYNAYLYIIILSSVSCPVAVILLHCGASVTITNSLYV